MVKKEVQRNDYLDFLSSHTHACIVAPPGFGKTTLLYQFSQRLKEPVCYVDFSRIGMSPDQFAIDYIGSLLFSHLQRHLKEKPLFSDLDYLKTLDVPGKELIEELSAEFEKKKPSNERFVKIALQFSQQFNTILIDNFDAIQSLNNYKEITSATKLFFAHLPKKLKLTTSQDLKLPIPTKKLLAFTRSEAQCTDEIYELTQGYPAALTYFTKESTKQDYIRALITQTHPLHQYLLRLLESGIANARGASLLEVVMKHLALSANITLSELALKINRSAPVTKSLLERLMEVGLVKRDAKQFSIALSVLQDFAFYYYTGMTFDTVDDKTLKEVMG
ncbi:hypothetical protein D6774_04110 [Candidatus Woesearchaeota archaeon]|nr:MAG: hypothetical protein D6774_04110 [Candidatus Woesearchaeota archaeon]